MIYLRREININDGIVEFNKPVTLRQGDNDIDIELKINGLEVQFRDNIIFYRYGIVKDGLVLYIEQKQSKNGILCINLKDLEVGEYSIAIQLIDSEKDSKITIPLIENIIEVLDNPYDLAEPGEGGEEPGEGGEEPGEGGEKPGEGGEKPGEGGEKPGEGGEEPGEPVDSNFYLIKNGVMLEEFSMKNDANGKGVIEQLEGSIKISNTSTAGTNCYTTFRTDKEDYDFSNFKELVFVIKGYNYPWSYDKQLRVVFNGYGYVTKTFNVGDNKLSLEQSGLIIESTFTGITIPPFSSYIEITDMYLVPKEVEEPNDNNVYLFKEGVTTELIPLIWSQDNLFTTSITDGNYVASINYSNYGALQVGYTCNVTDYKSVVIDLTPNVKQHSTTHNICEIQLKVNGQLKDKQTYTVLENVRQQKILDLSSYEGDVEISMLVRGTNGYTNTFTIHNIYLVPNDNL